MAAGVISADECAVIRAGLERIAGEFSHERFIFQETDEDIHTAIERRLGELIGPLAGKLHPGAAARPGGYGFSCLAVEGVPALTGRWQPCK